MPKKKSKIGNGIIILLLGLALGILLTLILFRFELISYPIKIQKIEEVKSGFNCSVEIPENNLIYSSYCLKEELDIFYNYNISNIAKTLTEQELKEEGGVCTHYAEWYYQKLQDTPFNKKIVEIKTSEDNYHVFAVVSNNESYCILDQLNVGCVNFQNVTKN